MAIKREKVKVEKRTVFGKKVKALRRDGLIPANVYGKDIKSAACTLSLKDFKEIFKKVHETGLIDLELDKDILPVLIHNVQFDPRSQEPIHADFYKVDLKEKIEADIPVEAVGEALAVIEKKGILLQLLTDLKVEALPTDLPENIEVNVEGLKEVDEEIPVSAIKVQAGVTVLNEPGEIVFKIGELISKEAEEQAKAEEAAAAEAKAETGAEAAAPTEGGEKPAEATKEAPKEEAK